MASGTQGYEAAQSGVIEKIIERFKNRKKDDGDGKDGKSPAPNQPASVSIATPTSSMLIEGTTVNKLMSGSSGLSRSPIDITKYGEDAILQDQLTEQQETNQLLTAQNQLLLSASTDGALSKFDRQEEKLEKTEDLSGTLVPEKVKKPTWLQDILKFLGNIISAIPFWGKAIVAAIVGKGLFRLANNLLKALNRSKNVLPDRRMLNITPKPNQITSGSVKPTNILTEGTSQAIDATKLTNIQNAIPVNPIKQPVLEGGNNSVKAQFDDIPTTVTQTGAKVDDVKDLSKIKNITPISGKMGDIWGSTKNFIGKIPNPLDAIKNANTAVRGSGAAHAIPPVSYTHLTLPTKA